MDVRCLLPVLLLLVLAGCAPAPATSQVTASATAESFKDSPEALLGTYVVEYRTSASDRAPVTDEVVVRNGEVSGSCSASKCDLTYTIELRAADGSTTTGNTDLSLEDTAYRGIQSSLFPCDGMTSLTTVEGGLKYTSETTITPTHTTVKDGRVVVTSFDVVTTERNEVTDAGREAGCLRINDSGPDPYASNTTTVGVGTRQP